MRLSPRRAIPLIIPTTRILWLAYLVGLTWLLLDSDPLRVIRPRENLSSLAAMVVPWSHLATFGLLAVLTFAARWPLPHWATIGLLAFYGLVTEFSQFYIPARHLDPVDLLKNFTGIAAGCGLAWAAGIVLSLRPSPHVSSV